MSKSITIKEYQFLQYVDSEQNNYISKESFDILEKFVLDNEQSAQYLKITTKRHFRKVIQAQNYVGIIQLKNGTTIEILPKITTIKSEEETKNILLKMLKELKKSPFKNFNKANLKSSKLPLLEIFIAMFLDELSNLIKKGLKLDYINKEKNLSFLRGKLNVGRHIKQNCIHKERFYVEFQELLANRVENKLIKTTLKYLYKKTKLGKHQQLIREFIFIFDEIECSRDIKIDFSKVQLNRQMKDYEQILQWARIFLLGNSFSPYKGADISFALLFDMNLLFENYVGKYLKKNGLDVSLQDTTHHLAYLEETTPKFQLKPDIVINRGEIIADTKWKILDQEKNHNGISQSDMYQLYAYGTKYKKCETMYLIYPKDNDVQENYYNYYNQKQENDLYLKVLFFDVANDYNSVEFLNKMIQMHGKSPANTMDSGLNS